MMESVELLHKETVTINGIELSQHFRDQRETDNLTNEFNNSQLADRAECGERVNQILRNRLDEMVLQFNDDPSLQARLLEMDNTRMSLSTSAVNTKLRRAVQRYTQYIFFIDLLFSFIDIFIDYWKNAI